MILSQSGLAAWSRCPAQFGYRRAGLPESTNSASAFGSVMHHVLEGFERRLADLRSTMNVRSPEYAAAFKQALEVAVETFAYYWHPQHIAAICEPVPEDGWLPRQGYSDLLVRGRDTIRKYADLIRFDDVEILALEYGFLVPIPGSWDPDLGEPHFLRGYIDRLAIRYYQRKATVCVDDWKSGREQTHLRHNVQFSAYSLATTQRQFWTGVDEDYPGFGAELGEKLFQRTKDYGRRGTWIDLRTCKFKDAGWRGPIDYERVALAANQLAAAIKADIFPLTISGEACTYCPFRRVCGVVGVPDDDHGRPGYAA